MGMAEKNRDNVKSLLNSAKDNTAGIGVSAPTNFSQVGKGVLIGTGHEEDLVSQVSTELENQEERYKNGNKIGSTVCQGRIQITLAPNRKKVTVDIKFEDTRFGKREVASYELKDAIWQAIWENRQTFEIKDKDLEDQFKIAWNICESLKSPV